MPSADAGGGHGAAGLVHPEGMNYNPPSERARIDEEESKKAEDKKAEHLREKSSEANRDRADYKTRAGHPDKRKDD